MVAGHDISLLIHAKAAVRIAVVGKANIQAVFNDELLQMFNVGRTAVRIDIETVRFRIYDISFSPDRIENALGDRPGGAVCRIQADFDILEAVFGQADQVADIAVAAGCVVNGAADLSAFRHGDFCLPVDIILDLQQRLFIHLFAVVVDDLDPVVIIGIV